MAIFKTQLYDKVHKKVMAIGSIEQMVQAYNMAKMAMGGDYEVRPHGCQKDGKAYTFDIVFVNDTDEVHMGLDTTLMGASATSRKTREPRMATSESTQGVRPWWGFIASRRRYWCITAT